MIYILAFIILIGVIVFVHELGHYLAARSVGVTVEQFSIGMPPTVYNYKPKNSDTVFSIGALPLGGYVKMKGILDENMDSSFTGADDELESKTALQKNLGYECRSANEYCISLHIVRSAWCY